MHVLEDLQITIKGAESKAIPLLAVADLFKEFHNLVDKSYLSLSGKKRLNKSDRELYQINTTNIENGSIIAGLSIIVPQLAQTAFEFHNTGFNATVLWELTKNTFEFSKYLASAKKKGSTPTIKQNNDPCAFNIINNGSGSVTVNVGSVVQSNASQSEQNIKSLAQNIDEKGIISFTALDKTSKGIRLTPKENQLFNPETIIDKTPFKTIVKIFKLDTESRNGRLRILQDQHVGEYSFKIINKQSINDYIHALEQEQSNIIALKEIVKHPTRDETLSSLHIINIS